jgi:hypothetical protein
VKMQEEELYQWGLMVGTPSTPEKGHGQYICEEIYYIYVEHMEPSFTPTQLGSHKVRSLVECGPFR